MKKDFSCLSSGSSKIWVGQNNEQTAQKKQIRLHFVIRGQIPLKTRSITRLRSYRIDEPLEEFFAYQDLTRPRKND